MSALLSHVQLFASPWTVAHQAPLSMGFPRQEYWSVLKLMSVHLVMPSIHLILFYPLLLLPSVFHSITQATAADQPE